MAFRIRPAATLTRRGFGLTAAAALLAPRLSRAAPPPLLEARPGTAQLAPEGYPATQVWGYDGTSPGPVLRVRQGARLERRVVNALEQPTSVHWHGIRIDNAMDGVAGLTQPPIPPGGSFDYAFDLPDAGTYWYHAHMNSVEQVARGLYGALIVEEPEAPEVDREELLILDDWRLDPETAQIDPVFDNFHDLSHAGRLGNIVTVNGRFELSGAARPGERLRLRLINASNARIYELVLPGFEGWVLALDGMPLEAPEALPERLVLAPGQRADLFVDVTADAGAEAQLAMAGGEGEALVLAAFAVEGPDAARRPAPEPLPPNPRQEVPGLATARRLTLHMEGGAMGGLRQATYKGKMLDPRGLAQAGQFWAFNGVAGRTETPLAELDLGETVLLEVVNDTAFAHAMHLHGMHARPLAPDGTPGPMRDTVLSLPGAPLTLAFVADNAGDWLLHCHMLGHAASGMMTWLRVRG